MAKADKAAEREAKVKYLQELVQSGKVTAPKEAHAALKKKFGSSLNFADASTVLGGGQPGDRPKRTRKKKAAGSKGRKGAEPPRFMVVSISDVGTRWEAETKAQAKQALQELLDTGHDPDDVAVYERQRFDAARSYKVNF